MTVGWLGDLASRWDESTNYARRPVDWVTDKLGEFSWSKQVEILESLQQNRYTAVHSAHDLGKSKVAANAISWWIDSHPIGEAFVVSTAPTAAQVSAILWREISKNMTKSQKHALAKRAMNTALDSTGLSALGAIPGKINRAGYPQWYVGSELVGYGRKPADYEESAFQGIHARYVLIVIDEACGVARHLFDAVDALATNANARVLAIGNPDDPGSHFASVCKPDSDWKVIHLDGLRSPNITKERVIGRKSQGHGYDNPRYPLLAALMAAEGIPYSTEVIPYDLNELLISELWIEERIRRWAGIGKTAHLEMAPDELQILVSRRCAQSSLFVSKVRGLFPSANTDGVIPLGWVTLAMNRWKDIFIDYNGRTPVAMLAARSGAKVIGIDVAGTGVDETVIATGYGSLTEKLERYHIADTMETADMAAVHMHEIGTIAITDVTGIGSGVHDRLNQMRKQGLILGRSVAFVAGAQSHRKDLLGEFRFRNDRAAAWWNMRELLDPSRGSNVAIPDDERLLEELCAPRYKVNVGGIIQVEEKAEIKKRLGRSTDSADAVIQRYWISGSSNVGEAQQWASSKPTDGVLRYKGYDPFTDTDFLPTENTPRVGAFVGRDGIFSSGDTSGSFADWDF
jgi:hypothetical protein